jgi:hypothetical protein
MAATEWRPEYYHVRGMPPVPFPRGALRSVDSVIPHASTTPSSSALILCTVHLTSRLPDASPLRHDCRIVFSIAGSILARQHLAGFARPSQSGVDTLADHAALELSKRAGRVIPNLVRA